MVYGVIQMLHLVFGLFFALVAVCLIRGISLHLYHAFKSPGSNRAQTPTDAPPLPAPAPAA